MLEKHNGMTATADYKDPCFILQALIDRGSENVGPVLIDRAEKALKAMENMNMDTVSVPREPTEAMVSAAINVFAKHPRTREQTARFRDTVRNAIKASLSTAPASPIVGEDAKCKRCLGFGEVAYCGDHVTCKDCGGSGITALLSRIPSEEATEEVQSSLERFLPTLESLEIRNVTGRDPESVKTGFDLARRSAVDAAKAFISADRAITRAPGAGT